MRFVWSWTLLTRSRREIFCGADDPTLRCVPRRLRSNHYNNSFKHVGWSRSVVRVYVIDAHRSINRPIRRSSSRHVAWKVRIVWRLVPHGDYFWNRRVYNTRRFLRVWPFPYREGQRPLIIYDKIKIIYI